MDHPSDSVRDAVLHGEKTPAPYVTWPLAECLRRTRIRFGYDQKTLAAMAGIDVSVLGRVERGGDVRLSTLRRIFAALGCRLVILPAGASYDLDWDDAHREDEWFEWKKAARRTWKGVDALFTSPEKVKRADTPSEAS